MVDGPHLLHTAKFHLLPNSMVHLPALLERVGTLRKKSAKRFYLYIYLGLLLYIIDIHDDPNIPLLAASWRLRVVCVNSRPAYVFNFPFSFSSLQSNHLSYWRSLGLRWTCMSRPFSLFKVHYLVVPPPILFEHESAQDFRPGNKNCLVLLLNRLEWWLPWDTDMKVLN